MEDAKDYYTITGIYAVEVGARRGGGLGWGGVMGSGRTLFYTITGIYVVEVRGVGREGGC